MVILNFLKEYWVVLSFFVTEIAVLCAFINLMRKSSKCTLRNDILDIYDRCKDKKQITRYQLQSIMYSYDLYKKYKGNSFVETIIEKEIPEFELID